MKKTEGNESVREIFRMPEMEVVTFETNVVVASSGPCSNVGCPGVCDSVCNPYCEIVK